MTVPGQGAANAALLELDAFVERFAHQYLTGGAVDHDRLRVALAEQQPGGGGIVHAFTDDGGSATTGLSYQSSIEEVLDAVLCGVAARLIADLADVSAAGAAAAAVDHPLAGLLEVRVTTIGRGDFPAGTTNLVRALSGDAS